MYRILQYSIMNSWEQSHCFLCFIYIFHLCKKRAWATFIALNSSFNGINGRSESWNKCSCNKWRDDIVLQNMKGWWISLFIDISIISINIPISNILKRHPKHNRIRHISNKSSLQSPIIEEFKIILDRVTHPYSESLNRKHK